MKNRHYGNAWKNTIILLQLLFSVLLLMSVFMVAALNGKHMIDMDNLTNQSYVDSSYYGYVYEQKVTELTNFLMTRKNFETNGEYDSEKQVNVIKYARSGIIRNDTEESYTMTLVRMVLRHIGCMMTAVSPAQKNMTGKMTRHSLKIIP